MIFFDDFSRKTWIYFLKCKESEDIVSKFKEFKTITKNSSEKKIKVLRIGVRQGLLYELCTKTNLAIVHETSDSNEIWHRRLGYINLCALISMEKVVTIMSKLKHIHNESFKGCALGKNTKRSFPHSLRKN